tara:strand:+ start:23526 stop:23963 length:438 start_codon:yes stop_codon:yes gene_type:complete
MSDLDPTKLKEDVSNLRFRWQNATKQYVDTYADKATGLDNTQNDRAQAAVVKTRADINIMQSKLKGAIETTAEHIQTVEKGPIALYKKQYADNKDELSNKINNGRAGKRMKVDKYNENSKTYILTSFYSIGILSITYFIYKQLKQ